MSTSESFTPRRKKRQVRLAETVSRRTRGLGNEPAFTSDISEVIRNEQNRERDTAEPPESDIVRVKDESGTELWMAPVPPQPIAFSAPETHSRSNLNRKEFCSRIFYRNGLILCSMIFISLAIFQVYAWILTKYYWPLHFLERIMDTEFYPGTHKVFMNWGGIILGAQQLFMAAWSLSAALCFKKRMLRLYFNRCVYFCSVNVAYIVLAIVFVSAISTKNVEDILKSAIDTYDYTVKHPQRVSKASNIGWDRLQQHQKCCGILNPDDWISQREIPGQINKGYKLPMSCCIVFKLDIFNALVLTPQGYLDDIEDCQLNPQLGSHWQDGCLLKLISFLDKYCAGFSFLQVATMITVCFSAFFGRRYYVVLKIESGSIDFDYTLPEALIQTFCLCCCIKYQKDVDTGRYVVIGRHFHHKFKKKATIAPAHVPLGNVELFRPVLNAEGRASIMVISAQPSQMSTRASVVKIH